MEAKASRTGLLVAAVLAASAADFTPAQVIRIADGRLDVLELSLAMHSGPPGSARAILGALRIMYGAVG